MKKKERENERTRRSLGTGLVDGRALGQERNGHRGDQAYEGTIPRSLLFYTWPLHQIFHRECVRAASASLHNNGSTNQYNRGPDVPS
jgi:hypothetical protein